MEQLVQDTVNFLEEENDTSYNFFVSTMTTEIVIPKTKKAIKSYILPVYKDLRNANFLINNVYISNAIKRKNLLLNDDVENDFKNYFSQEKECLKKLKTLLTLKSHDYPNVSISGIVLTAIKTLHIANQKQLSNVIEIGTSLQRSRFNVYFPENKLKPINQEIIETINTGLERVLVKK